MQQSVTLSGWTVPRVLSAVFGLGMIVASAMTIQHYFAANFPESIFEGSFCDISAFFNCDSSAFSNISAIAGIPLGYPGLFVGGLVMLGSLFPSASFERSNKFSALITAVGVVTLLCYTVFFLGSLCLLCSGYYLSSLASFVLFWMYGVDRGQVGFIARFFRPSLKHLATYAVVLLVGAYGFSLFHDAKEDAQTGGVAGRIVDQFYSLPLVDNPSFISPFWTAQATESFTDAPIQIVDFADPLCPDCRFLADQLAILKEEFAGQMNVSFQFFPLEGVCNDVVEKDLHPGACEVSWMMAKAPDSETFLAMHDEVFANLRAARAPEWRVDFAQRYGVEGAAEDEEAKSLIQRMIQTGTEYAQTSEQFSHGIRSTPTMIINNRMVIGTLPIEQMRAIFQSLVADYEQGGGQRFIENWVGPGD